MIRPLPAMLAVRPVAVTVIHETMPKDVVAPPLLESQLRHWFEIGP